MHCHFSQQKYNDMCCQKWPMIYDSGLFECTSLDVERSSYLLKVPYQCTNLSPSV